MSMINESGQQAFIAGADLAQAIRVKRSTADTVVPAMAADGDNWIGTTVEARNSGRQITVRLRTAPGTVWFTASGAIGDDTPLAVDDNGQVQAATTGSPVTGYRSNEAAAEAGDIIEAQKAGGFAPAVVALTSGQIATANATDLASAEALANATKAAYNQLQTDFTNLRTALLNSGSIKAS